MLPAGSSRPVPRDAARTRLVIAQGRTRHAAIIAALLPLLALLLTLPLVPARVPSPPKATIRRPSRSTPYHTDWITGTPRTRVIVRGLVKNRVDHPATWEGIRLAVLDADGVELAIGYGFPLLPVLAPGEDGPFEVRAVLPGPAEPGDLQLSLKALGGQAAADRDRSLRVDGVLSTTLSGQAALLGEVHNDGPHYLQAAETRIHVAFFEGDRLVAMRAATLPVVQGAGVEGQGHGPGRSLSVADGAARSRLRDLAGVAARRALSRRSIPVPLGLLDPRYSDLPGDEPAVRVEADLVHCGFRSVREARLVVVARSMDGRLARFAAGDLVLPGPLSPGASLPVQIDLSGVGLSEVEGLSLRPYALASQSVRPSAWPCATRPNYARLWLPSLSTDRPETEGGLGAFAQSVDPSPDGP